MESVGEILKKSRKIKKVKLPDVSQDLKISEDILNNIECDHFQKDIDTVFLIGHLRSYCSYLDLSPNKIIELYKSQHFPQVNKKIEIERPKFEFKTLFSNKLISLSLIVIIFTTFYFVFIEVEKPSREYAIIPDLPENYISIVEEANLTELQLNKNVKIDLEKNFAEIENVKNSSSAIASVPNNELKESETVTLKFLDDTWVQLRDLNDKIILSKVMNKNDEYSYDILNNYSITSGNAGHILVLINQKVRGKIGKKGQVVDSLVINKNFNN